MDRLTIESDVNCKNVLRMNRDTFKSFCFLLKQMGGLTESRFVCVEEKVATFLAVLGHHTKQRVAMFGWRRSGWTISTYFN